MEITVPCTAIVAGWLRSDVPAVLISRPAIAISLHPLRKKKVALDVKVKQSVTSWLQKICTYLSGNKLWYRGVTCSSVSLVTTWRCVVYHRNTPPCAHRSQKPVLIIRVFGNDLLKPLCSMR